MRQRGYRLDKRDDDTQRDGDNQREVKDTSCRPLRLKHNAIEILLLKPFGFLHTYKSK